MTEPKKKKKYALRLKKGQAAAAAACVAIISWFLRKANLGAACAGLGALLAIGGAILWRASCGAFGQLIFWIAAALAVLAIIAADIFLRGRKSA